MIFGDLRDIKTEKHVTEVSLKRKTESRLWLAPQKHRKMLRSRTTGIRFFNDTASAVSS